MVGPLRLPVRTLGCGYCTWAALGDADCCEMRDVLRFQRSNVETHMFDEIGFVRLMLAFGHRRASGFTIGSRGVDVIADRLLLLVKESGKRCTVPQTVTLVSVLQCLRRELCLWTQSYHQWKLNRLTCHFGVRL